MRKPQDITAHIREARYIAHAWDGERAAFSYDRECFNRYVNMQADFAEKDGFPGVAADMRKHLLAV